MKCWKCGKDIPDNASICTYCSTSTARKNAVTAAGKAMRMIYDRFGYESVFDKKSILSVALGDVLEDSRKLRGQVDMALSAGVGNVYINQLQNTGKPDAAFFSRVKVLMTEEAGLSDKVTSELMGYFDEMIGWTPAPQPASQNKTPGGATASRPAPTPNREIPRPSPAPKREIPRPNPVGEAARSSHASVPLRDPAVQDRVLDAAVRAGMIRSKPEVKADIPDVLVPNKPHDTSRCQKLMYSYKKGVLEVRWFGKLNKFALAINGIWITTGSGNSIQVPIELRAYSHIVIAEITEKGVFFIGDANFIDHKQLYRR